MCPIPSFRIGLDTERRLLRVTVEGHFDAATVLAFGKEFREALAGWHARPGKQPPLRMLIDAREAVAQSRDIIDLFEPLKKDVAGSFDRTARLVGSTLHQMQVKRLNSGAQNGVFRREEEALAWLMADPEPGA